MTIAERREEIQKIERQLNNSHSTFTRRLLLNKLLQLRKEQWQ